MARDTAPIPWLVEGGDAPQLVSTSLDALLGTLGLDLAFARVVDPAGEKPIAMVRVPPSPKLSIPPEEIAKQLHDWLGDEPEKRPRSVRSTIGAAEMSLVVLHLGSQGDIGVLVVGSDRPDFPGQAESLVLSAAAGQVTLGLTTIALSAANDVLKNEVAELRRTEEALRASESDLRTIVDSLPGLIHVMRPDGVEELFNRQLLDYFGKTTQELRAWEHNDAVHPDDVGRLVAARARAIPAGEPYDVEHRCRRNDGVYRWFHSRTRPVRDPNGAVTGWYSLMSDIDDRKRAEDALRRSEAFLVEGQRLARMGNFSWRVEAGEITWSEQVYRMFELEPGTPLTLELISGRVHPEDIGLFHDMVEQAQLGVSDFGYEHRLLMPDHSVKYLHLIAHGTRDGQGRLEYFGAVQDVTQRRLAEEALSSARSELARVARFTSFGAFTASITHEVNQPLSGIVTNAGTCLRMLAADPPNLDGARETARRTIRDGQRASDVIARLRGLFTKQDAIVEPVDLNEATREVLALSMSELKRGRVVVHADLPDNLPLVRGDRVQLQQVILNLVMNAADAMSAVADRPRELGVRTEREAGGVRLTVRDTGIGFDAQVADQLFEAFYTTKSGGMGIGLSVSRSIIDRHHGRLWALPNEGPGATFAFSIPDSVDAPPASY